MTRKEQILENALTNLLERIERGQEYPMAEWSVVIIYGVSPKDLSEAYMDFCCLNQPGGDREGLVSHK